MTAATLDPLVDDVAAELRGAERALFAAVDAFRAEFDLLPPEARARALDNRRPFGVALRLLLDLAELRRARARALVERLANLELST